MLKLTLLVFAVVLIETSGYLIKVPASAWRPQTGLAPVQKQEWVYIQNRMMPLFENVCEESLDPVIINLSKEFATDFGNGNFWNPEVITRFQNYKTSNGFLAKGEIFSEINQDHINQLKLIFEILYFAKDFATFYKVAAWARQNTNCGLYVDAIYLSILHRRDIEKISIPPPYELLPNYFVNKDAIIKSSLLMANQEFIDLDNIREQGNSYIIDASYSNSYYENNVESLAYFQEDLGLNSFYFIQKLKMSPWLNVSLSMQPKYGEHIYHVMKQLMTRYNLERYSNGLPELENFDWNEASFSTYNPMLIYSNGKDFSQSSSNISINDNEDIILLRNIENNIVTVTSHMSQEGYSKEEILNHLLQILVTNNNSYENVALKVLGNNVISEQSSPSALAHYLTRVRDPIFWKINKKLVDLVDIALGVLPGYVRNDLIFPGVEIGTVDIKKMLTSFDYYEFDVTDALKTSTRDTNFQMKIGQYRLNHKPFSIKLNISSLITQKGFAKIFIGPKVLPGEFAKMKNLFFLLDSFEINLKKGKNTITRTSNEMNLSKDLVSLEIIKKRLEDAGFGLNALPLESLEKQIGFPLRLILPKGSENGLTFQIFILVSPYIKPSVAGRIANVEYNLDALLNPGFPFDLNIDMNQLLNLPNAIVKDVIITHKVENKPTKEVEYDTQDNNNIWSSSEIDKPTRLLKLSARPEFTKKKEPFDYKSKKGQYGKKENYSAKRVDLDNGKNIISNISTSDDNTVSIKNESQEDIEVEIKKELNDIDKSVYKIITEKVRVEKVNQEPISSINEKREEETDVKILPQKRKPTVYNFFFNKPQNEYSSEEKIYE